MTEGEKAVTEALDRCSYLGKSNAMADALEIIKTIPGDLLIVGGKILRVVEVDYLGMSGDNEQEFTVYTERDEESE